MKTIIVTTQAELDALPKSFDEFTAIEIRSAQSAEIVVRTACGSSMVKACGSSTVRAYDSSTVTAYDSSTVRAFGSPTVTAYDSSTVRACGSSTVTAYDSSTVTAYDSSTVTACGSSTVRAYGSSTVRACGSSTVTAYDSSTVRARGSSTVTACGSSTVTAYGSSTVRACGSSTVTACSSSTVTAYDSSTVRACGSSTVTAYGSSTVRACDSSTVTACGSSTVTAYDSSTVTACGSSTVTAYDSSTTLDVLSFAVAVLWAAAKVRKKDKFAKVVRHKVRKAKTLPEWVEINAAESRGASITLYKRVSADLKTQEGTENETTWTIGAAIKVPVWTPEGQECGPGKFHGCPAPFFCDEFRTKAGDRYIAIKVAKKDCYVWPDAEHPHKIAFRRGTVLHECDRSGKKIGGAA